MNKLTFKEIPKTDEEQLRRLITNMYNETPPEFIIPYEEWELKKLFDKTYFFLYGAYDGETLAGIAQLCVLEDMLKEIKEKLNIVEGKVCELGGCLVLKKYRGQAIQSTFLKMRYDLAKKLGYNYITATAHPENTVSTKNIENAGLKFEKQTLICGNFLRNIYCKKLFG